MLAKYSLFLLLGTLTSSSVRAEDFLLPGLETMTQDDQDAYDSYIQCLDDSNVILKLPQLVEAFYALGQAVTMKLQDAKCEASGDDAICDLNYQTSASSDYKAACEANKGLYYESDQTLTCRASSALSITGTVTWLISNYPFCFSSTCLEADIERLIATDLDLYELKQEDNAVWVCDSGYAVEEPDLAKRSSSRGICPNRVKNTHESCSPLLPNIQGQTCDCYAFCNGVLLGCETFNAIEPSDFFCPGDLVMGCTAALFTSGGMGTSPLILSIVSLMAATISSFML
jgi:hypothetical protein